MAFTYYNVKSAQIFLEKKTVNYPITSNKYGRYFPSRKYFQAIQKRPHK